MLVDWKKLTNFTVSESKDVLIDINGKKVIYSIPYVLGVNKENQRIYVGKCFDHKLDLTDEDIDAILSGDKSLINKACTEFVFNLILRNRYCKK